MKKYIYDLCSCLKAFFAGFQNTAFSIKCREEKNDMLKLGVGFIFQGRSGFSSSVKYVHGWQDGYHEQGIIGELRIEF